jgi:hypothetical protein
MVLKFVLKEEIFEMPKLTLKSSNVNGLRLAKDIPIGNMAYCHIPGTFNTKTLCIRCIKYMVFFKLDEYPYIADVDRLNERNYEDLGSAKFELEE